MTARGASGGYLSPANERDAHSEHRRISKGGVMKLKARIALAIAVLVGISTGPAIAQNQSDHTQNGHREIVVATTSSWNGTADTHYPTGQPQLTTIRLTLAPHTVLPWHTHPFPNSVYVLSGTLTLRNREDGK